MINFICIGYNQIFEKNGVNIGKVDMRYSVTNEKVLFMKPFHKNVFVYVVGIINYWL